MTRTRSSRPWTTIKAGNYKPYLLMSADRGRTWTNIGAGLPDRTIVWSVAQDNVKKDLLFAGTEFGIYVTARRRQAPGRSSPAGSRPSRSGTSRSRSAKATSSAPRSGAGFFILDDYSPLRELDATGPGPRKPLLFTPRKALMYMPFRAFDSDGKGFFGEGLLPRAQSALRGRLHLLSQGRR